MARKPRSITIDLTTEAGRHQFAQVGETLMGGGEFDPSLGVYRDLATGEVHGPGEAAQADSPTASSTPTGPRLPVFEGLPVAKAARAGKAAYGLAKRAVVGSERVVEGGLGLGSSLMSLHSVRPPVPGSFGKWVGKGTKRDPYRWVGVPERALGYALLALIAVWGAEVIETDVSNWWQTSVLNVGNDLTTIRNDILAALGYPTSTDSTGKVTAVGARQHATFLSWFFNQVSVQGGDLQAAVDSINGVATGFTPLPPPGSGLSATPPTGTSSTVTNQPPAGYGNDAYGHPITAETLGADGSVVAYSVNGLGPPPSSVGCNPGFTMMTSTVTLIPGTLACVRNDQVSTYQGYGWAVVNLVVTGGRGTGHR